MNLTTIKKMDNKNRLLLPMPLLKQLGIKPNGEVYIVKNDGEDCLRIYKKDKE